MSRRKPYEFQSPSHDAPMYWTSLEDRAEQVSNDPEARAALAAEFPGGHADGNDAVSRRSFMALMGAAVSLATLEGCRRPEDNILPYTRQPDDVTVNVTAFYATVMDRRGDAVGLLVESHEGRPTKIEGNPDHPGSRGKTDLLAQAAILDLYCPDRLRRPSMGAEEKRYEDFEAALAAAVASHAGGQGQGLRFLHQPSISPTFVRMRQAVMQRYPNARFHCWSAASNSNAREGARMAFGTVVNPVVAYERARVIVSVDSDFLQTETGVVRNTRAFAASRTPGESMSRLYVVEPTHTTTGANADHRLRLPGSTIEGWLRAVAARLIGSHDIAMGNLTDALRGATAPEGVPERWVNTLAAELAAHRGSSVLVAGSRQPPSVHALVHALNQALGNAGQTVTYVSAVDDAERDNLTDLVELARDLEAGQAQSLIILGGNPVYDAPADLDLGAKIARARFSAHLSMHHDETGERCQWRVPRTHFLEAWGDAQGLDGTVAVQQPLIQPLYRGWSDIELLARVADTTAKRGYELVRETHQGNTPAVLFERAWRRALNRGVLTEAQAAPQVPPIRSVEMAAALRGRAASPVGRANLEVNFVVDAKMHDGREASNAWLAELPDPITRITWDNAAYFSPATAEALGVASGDKVRLTKGNRAVEIVAWVLPGQADWSVGLPLGWGRTKAGRVGTGRGFDVNPLRSSANPWFLDGVSVTKTGDRYPISQTQDHHRMEGRPIAVEATLAQYNETPNFAAQRSPTPRTLPLWQEVNYDDPSRPDLHKWAMTIDLNLCTGCNACAVACQAENNVPVVGKERVAQGREMHWLRVDRYFVSPALNSATRGDDDPGATSDPMTAFQPLACVHCEEAPCENVCPVNATVHSPEGLNEMAYNRCIGTRYCANNCPYKVRRFNYLNFHNDGVYQPDWFDMPETVRMQMNPNVTVRFRGVMEKCTYCVQRIQSRKIEAKREGNRPMRDGELATACQQACPADAIVFGDLHDRESRIARMHREDRRYALLGEIGTQPRTTYLAKIRNPNPEMLG
ncbi:MAG: TAT-variant-translocated molybdopterin oxidoreductase [Polyangiales bacterium]